MRFFVIIISFFSFFSCRSVDPVPEGVLKQQEMRKLMWDLMRADAYISDFVMKDSTRNAKQESAIMYEKIFAIHTTTEEEFKRSLRFYEERPHLLKPIADSLKADEKKAQEYENYGKPAPPDTMPRRIKPGKKPAKQ